MNYVGLINNTPNEVKQLFRKVEVLNKKLINNNWSVVFNKTCLKENLLPKYSDFKIHDPAVRRTTTTLNYRKYLTRIQLENKEKLINQQSIELREVEATLNLKCQELNIDKEIILEELEDILDTYSQSTKIRIVKKLQDLYQGQILLKNETSCYTNLSDYVLSKDEIDFLNLGLQYHVQPKYDKLTKQVQMEILYENLIQLEKESKISIEPTLPDQLASEANKHRNTKHKPTIPKSLRTAAFNLKNCPDIVIKKADKSSTYVILNKKDYDDKIFSILSDDSKFQKIDKDITNSVKQKANKVINAVNSIQDGVKLKLIVGDYLPGYIYGNVKTHKQGNPLRPVISQVTTPTYQLSKTINKIITPYLPSNYILKNTNDFIDILATASNLTQSKVVSLDVESLFTNVPIEDTIEIIIKHVYSHPNISPPKISKHHLSEILRICTKELPFTAPDGSIYKQIEGVAMGSPLGPTFANFYMGHLEENVFQIQMNKPLIYARYVDDIFVVARDASEVHNLKHYF